MSYRNIQGQALQKHLFYALKEQQAISPGHSKAPFVPPLNAPYYGLDKQTGAEDENGIA